MCSFRNAGMNKYLKSKVLYSEKVFLKGQYEFSITVCLLNGTNEYEYEYQSDICAFPKMCAFRMAGMNKYLKAKGFIPRKAFF